MKLILLTITSLTFAFYSNAQTQIENGNFETWENEGNDDEEPTQWSSLKTSDDDSWLNLANQAPQVLWKETNNPHSGSACAKLTVASYNALAGLSPNAIMTNGRVFASTTPSDAYIYSDLTDSKWNTSCTDKPDSLIGWYKYAPQSGDKGKIEVLFHTDGAQGQLPTAGTTSHIVGDGIIEFTSAKSSWTRFSFPITYGSTSDPDYFLIVATAGDETNAVTGSELLLDDLSFVYNPPAPPVGLAEVQIEYTLFANQNQINVNVLNSFEAAQLSLYSLSGKEVWNTSMTEQSNQFQPNLNTGIYIYKFIVDNKVYSGKISLN